MKVNPNTEVIEARAPKGGEELYGKLFKAGEFIPFYVPRDRMPQVDEADLPALVTWAQHQGVGVKKGEISPKLLRAHQRVSIDRVLTITPALLAKPVLISVDEFILDGNHRWYGHVLNRSMVPYWRFSIPFDKAIPWLFEFPKTYCYADGKHNQEEN